MKLSQSWLARILTLALDNNTSFTPADITPAHE